MFGVWEQENRPTRFTVNPTDAVAAPSWFLVRTLALQEYRAEQHLTEQGIGVLLPKLPAKRKSGTHLVLYPTYLFAFIPQTLISKVNHTPGVLNIVQFGATFAVVAPELIDGILQRLDEHACLIDKMPARFNRGDRVRVISGPLQGHEAIFDTTLSGKDLARVLLNTVAHFATQGISCSRQLQDLKGGAFRVTVNVGDLALV
jgi:transcriptional antiterminator RfaH